MTEHEFIQAIQSRAARVAVGASTVRGRGNAGTVKAARNFLCSLDLTKSSPDAGLSFRDALDASTEALRIALPETAQHWGIARKVVNIFLRDCLYTTYLEAAFSLRSQEHMFELPSDSITALQLKRSMGRGRLPQWPGVKSIRPSLNTVFQKAAAAEAAKRGVARIHLDALWWSVSRDDRWAY
jgi:hypothetical protein